MTARKAERLRWRKPPLPRAVRELLRDVVLYTSHYPSIVKRAARLLGSSDAAIVARARKVSK